MKENKGRVGRPDKNERKRETKKESATKSNSDAAKICQKKEKTPLAGNWSVTVDSFP